MYPVSKKKGIIANKPVVEIKRDIKNTHYSESGKKETKHKQRISGQMGKYNKLGIFLPIISTMTLNVICSINYKYISKSRLHLKTRDC